uniref:Uncharacterized protein n=1 Tax=Myotis myotis TaxID=51298 RepID=A0A7J7XH50_MYOMY|nr:hypothetical protein mMyoMyo1_011620 [Myotis myotis]
MNPFPRTSEDGGSVFPAGSSASATTCVSRCREFLPQPVTSSRLRAKFKTAAAPHTLASAARPKDSRAAVFIWQSKTLFILWLQTHSVLKNLGYYFISVNQWQIMCPILSQRKTSDWCGVISAWQ